MTEDPNSRSMDLPLLYQGVTEEVLSELAASTTRFGMKAAGNIDRGNPNLTGLMMSCHETPNPTVSLIYTMAYYEILRRSAEREGKAMLIVSKETLKALFEEQVDEGQRNQQLGSRDQLTEMHKIFLDVNARIRKDREKSPELGEFWMEIEEMSIMFIQEGQDEQSVYFTFEPLFTLQEALQRQAEANGMEQAFQA